MAVSTTDLSSIRALHDQLVDIRNGYEEGLTLTTDTNVVTVFRDMLEMRDQHIDQLDNLLRKCGETPNANGTWMTPVQEAIMWARSWFGGLDKSVFAGVLETEDQLLKTYDTAIDALASDPESSALLSEQKQQVAGKLVAIRALDSKA